MKRSQLFTRQTDIIAVSVIIFILIQLFAAPEIKTYSSHYFTVHYRVYYLIVPTIGCFVSGMLFGSLLNKLGRWNISKRKCNVISKLGIILGIVSIFVSALGIVEVITGNLSMFFMFIDKIMRNRYLSILFIRIMPFICGWLSIQTIIYNKRKEYIL